MMGAPRGATQEDNAMDEDYKYAKFWIAITLASVIFWLWACAIASRLITGA